MSPYPSSVCVVTLHRQGFFTSLRFVETGARGNTLVAIVKIAVRKLLLTRQLYRPIQRVWQHSVSSSNHHSADHKLAEYRKLAREAGEG